MHRGGFARTCATVRAACTLSLFAVSLFGAGLRFAWSATIGRLGMRHTSDAAAHKAAWAEEEFRFECAIEKYEDLIDTAARRRR